MRVLILHPRFKIFGGAELVVARLCRSLADRGIGHALLTAGMNSEIRKEFPRTRIISGSREGESPNRFTLLGRLAKAVRKYAPDFDVVNVHNFPAHLAAPICPKPVVWLCNEPEPHILLPGAKSLKAAAVLKFWCLLDTLIVKHWIDRPVVADAFNFRRFQSLYQRDPEIVPYGIDYEFFEAPLTENLRQSSSWADRFIVLHIGWVQPLKNQLKSLETLHAVRSKIPNALLLFAGTWDPAYKVVLDRYIREHHLEKMVVFCGHVNREKIRALFHACDVLLHPVTAVGGWLAPFEAMSAGKPVIVPPALTMSETILREGIGLVTEDFSSPLIDAFQEPEKFSRMARKGQTWVREHLSWETFTDRMIRCFEKAIRRG